jgi:hypothetical protein
MNVQMEEYIFSNAKSSENKLYQKYNRLFRAKKQSHCAFTHALNQ